MELPTTLPQAPILFHSMPSEMLGKRFGNSKRQANFRGQIRMTFAPGRDCRSKAVGQKKEHAGVSNALFHDAIEWPDSFYPAIHKRCSSATCTVQVSNGHHTDWLITDHRPKPCPHPARQGHRISGDRLARGGSRRWRGQIAMCFTRIRVECDPDDFTFGIDRAC